MSGSYVALLVVQASVGLMIWGWREDNRNDREDREKREKECEDWLNEQKILPPSRVVTLTKSGKSYSTEYFRPFAKVRNWGIGGWQTDKESSSDKATNFIERQIRLGRFQYENIYIPLCEIESMEIKECK